MKEEEEIIKELEKDEKYTKLWKKRVYMGQFFRNKMHGYGMWFDNTKGTKTSKIPKYGRWKRGQRTLEWMDSISFISQLCTK